MFKLLVRNPLCVLLQVSLTGVQPVAALGHSLGEWTCAAFCGALGEQTDASRIAARRGELTANLGGAMVAPNPATRNRGA